MMDFNKFDEEPSASREKLNALLNEYQKEYHSKCSNKLKSQEPVIVEPKFKRRRKNNMNCLVKLLIHGIFYCNNLHLLPCDSGILLNLPPWQYEKRKSRINIEEFLIEPDWNSS